MADDTEENKYPFISESVYGNYYNISAAVKKILNLLAMVLFIELI